MKLSWLHPILGFATIGIIWYLVSQITPETAHGGGLVIAFVVIIAPAISFFFVAALAMEHAAPWRWWVQPMPYLIVAITGNSEVLWTFEWVAICLIYGPVVVLLAYLFFGKPRKSGSHA